MTQKGNHQLIRPADTELFWGLLYLPASLFLLPALLRYLNGMLPTPLNSTWFNFAYFSCNFLFVLCIFHGYWRRSLAQVGRRGWRFTAAILLGTGIYWLLNSLLGFLLQYLSCDYVNLNDSTIQSMASGNFPIVVIGTVLLVPMAEETLYRGLIFGFLYTKNRLAAYLVSAAVFSAIHLLGYIGSYSAPHLLLAFIQYLPAGFVLAEAYRFSGSIFAPIVIHGGINAIGLMLLR